MATTIGENSRVRLARDLPTLDGTLPAGSAGTVLLVLAGAAARRQASGHPHSFK